MPVENRTLAARLTLLILACSSILMLSCFKHPPKKIESRAQEASLKMRGVGAVGRWEGLTIADVIKHLEELYFEPSSLNIRLVINPSHLDDVNRVLSSKFSLQNFKLDPFATVEDDYTVLMHISGLLGGSSWQYSDATLFIRCFDHVWYPSPSIFNS